MTKVILQCMFLLIAVSLSGCVPFTSNIIKSSMQSAAEQEVQIKEIEIKEDRKKVRIEFFKVE